MQHSTVVRSNLLLAVVAALAFSVPAHAGGGGATMPWDGPLQALADNLTGPVAKIVVLLAAGIAGLVWAFSDAGAGAKRVAQLVVGGAIMIFAAQFITGLGLGGALL